MNKIFKKVWNKRRACFVAVSEVMTAASQWGGQGRTAILISGLYLLTSPIQVNALTTINGDATFDSLPLRMSSVPSSYNYVNDDVLVTGNLTFNSGSTILYVGNTSGSVGIPDITVTVNGNFEIANDRTWTIAHNHNRGQDVNGSTIIHGNAINYGLIEIGTRNTSHQGDISANFSVDNTLFNYGVVENNSNNEFGQANLTGTLSIGVMENHGVFRMPGGNVIGTFRTIKQKSGSFTQSENNTFFVEEGVTLSGGTLNVTAPLVIGERSGLFSIGKYLTLDGGSLNQTSKITLKASDSILNVISGTYNFESLNKENGTLLNAGTLNIGTLTQSAGSASNSGTLTISNANLGGSLNNTGTLTFTGGVTTYGNLASTGTLNNRGSWTEADGYTVQGTLNNQGTINFQNGFSIAGSGRLNSSGTIQTNNALNIFDSLGSTGNQDLHYIGLNTDVPQEVKTSLTAFFQKYVPGTVAQSLIDHASFTGGKVIVTGVNLTTTQRDDLVQAFKAKFFLLFPNVSTSAVSQQC